MSSGRDMVRAAYCHPHVKYMKSARLQKSVMPISHNFQSKGSLYVRRSGAEGGGGGVRRTRADTPTYTPIFLILEKPKAGF